MSNILDRANKIINERAEEKERQYGPIAESLARTAELYNIIRPAGSPQLDTEQVFKVLIALKLSREGYAHKEDNLLDAVAYIGALNNYLENE